MLGRKSSSSSRIKQYGKIPVAHKEDNQIISINKEEALRLELEHFIECVKERKRPKTDGNKGLRVLKVLANAEKALLQYYGDNLEK